MADMHQSSDSQQRALPAKVEIPQITGLSTAFPMEIESSKGPNPHRGGDTRKVRRHDAGH
ncbi:MAG: hypothetical protein JJ974_04710 [Phycisphaerales bacterium]|nr:hypothetical protein [Phycisphaerales bacterium]